MAVHRPTLSLYHLLLLIVIQTEASFLLDRSQQSSTSTLSSTKETPLHAMLNPDAGLFSNNNRIATVTAQSLQTEEKEDHPQPVQHQFDRATSTTATTASTIYPSDRKLAGQFEPAKEVWDWVPFSTSWRNQCKEIAAERQEKFDPENNKKKAEEIQKTLEGGLELKGKEGRPRLKRQNAVRGSMSGNLQRQNGMSERQMGKELQELGVMSGGVVKESMRKKVLTKLTEFKKSLPSMIKKSMDDFIYDLRCNPWTSLKISVSVGLMVVGAVFPAAAVGIVIAGLVKIAIEATMEAAEEKCMEGAGYIFVRTAVIETGLAIVGIPINEGLDAAAAVAAEKLFDATDEAILIIRQAENIAKGVEMILDNKIQNFKCSCGTVNAEKECEPTDGPTNPLYRLKERAKTLFKKGEEDKEDVGKEDDDDDDDDDDEFSDARNGEENGGEVVDGEVYHDTKGL